MHHEGAPSPATPERHEEREQDKSPFNLDRMEPRQVAAITSALSLAWDVARDSNSPHEADYEALLDQLDRDLTDAAATSDKAMDIYGELVEGDLASAGTMNLAAQMIPDLLRRNLYDPERRQRIVDSLIHMRDYKEGMGLARDAAWHTVGELWMADWLDDDTKQYLDDQFPD